MSYLKDLIKRELSLSQRQWNQYINKYDAELKRAGRFIANTQRKRVEEEVWSPLEIRYLRDGIDRIVEATVDKVISQIVQEDGTLPKIQELLERTPTWLKEMAPNVFETFYGLQIHFIIPLHRESWDRWVESNNRRYPIEHPEVVTHYKNKGPDFIQVIDTLGPYDEITADRHPGIKYLEDSTILLTLPCGYSAGKTLWFIRKAAERPERKQKISPKVYLSNHPEILEQFKDSIRSVVQYYGTGGNNGYKKEINLGVLPNNLDKDALVKHAKLEATKSLIHGR